MATTTATEILEQTDNQWLLELWPTIVEQCDVPWYGKARTQAALLERIAEDVDLHMKCTRDLDLTARLEVQEAIRQWWRHDGFWTPKLESYLEDSHANAT